MKKTTAKRKHYKYKNLTLLCLGLVSAFFVYRFEPLHTFLLSFGSYGYLGAFLAGIMSVSAFTAATGIIILLVLAESLLPIEVAALAGLGAVCGDLVIFRYVRDGLIAEVQPLFKKFGGKHLATMLHTKYFSWTLPFIGALIIISPFPDELGVSLLGIAKMSTLKFLILSFSLNTVGVLLIVTLVAVIKP